ncbi:MAG: FAD-binding oxidoreductase, partial [Planctomycetota bacterium]
TLKLEPLPPAACLCVVHFDDLFDSIRAVPRIVSHQPSAVELLDRRVITMARRNLGIAPLCDFFEGDPAAVLIVEFIGESPQAARRRVVDLIDDLQGARIGSAYPIRDDPDGMNRVWAVRKAGLGLLLGMKGERKPLPFIEDVAVPVDVLAEYIERIFAFCHSLETEVVLYAHASVGLLHVRPMLNLRDPADVERMRRISEHAFELVQHYGGSWSGEHGNGLARSEYNERFFGPKIYQALRDVKRLFDPRGLMNPGKIVDAPPMDRDLRVEAGCEPPAIDTIYHFREDGGCLPAAEMCSGIGACRATLAGTMCPSFRATRDEHDGVRGRANALRLAMTGALGFHGFGDHGLAETLELCLSCKACKSECPSGVDVARLRSEVLQHRHDQYGASQRDQWIAGSRAAAERIAGWKAPLVNWAQSSRLGRWLLEGVIGVDRRRVLPPFARRTFMHWFRGRRSATSGPEVALFVDTYLNFYEPHIGRAAVELLESCGYRVVAADVGCCQRPRISHGFLRDARRDG